MWFAHGRVVKPARRCHATLVAPPCASALQLRSFRPLELHPLPHPLVIVGNTSRIFGPVDRNLIMASADVERLLGRGLHDRSAPCQRIVSLRFYPWACRSFHITSIFAYICRMYSRSHLKRAVWMRSFYGILQVPQRFIYTCEIAVFEKCIHG